MRWTTVLGFILSVLAVHGDESSRKSEDVGPGVYLQLLRKDFYDGACWHCSRTFENTNRIRIRSSRGVRLDGRQYDSLEFQSLNLPAFVKLVPWIRSVGVRAFMLGGKPTTELAKLLFLCRAEEVLLYTENHRVSSKVLAAIVKIPTLRVFGVFGSALDNEAFPDLSGSNIRELRCQMLHLTSGILGKIARCKSLQRILLAGMVRGDCTSSASAWKALFALPRLTCLLIENLAIEDRIVSCLSSAGSKIEHLGLSRCSRLTDLSGKYLLKMTSLKLVDVPYRIARALRVFRPKFAIQH